MLSRASSLPLSNQNGSWTWIRKLNLLKKLKFLFWLTCHNSVPTLSHLDHRNISPSVVFIHCGLAEETFLHCVRDCTFSRSTWQLVGFNDPKNFSDMDVSDWLKVSSMGSQTFLFAAYTWWACVIIILWVPKSSFETFQVITPIIEIF